MVSQIQGMGSMMGGGMQFKMGALSEDQKSQVQTILAQYDPDNVSSEDAKSIFQAFREAGIKPGAGMKETIEAAGFDAEDLRAKGRPDGPPPPPPQGKGNGSSTGINLKALQSLQEILSQYNLADMSEDDQSGLLGQLQSQGFMNPGIMIDLKS